VAGLASKLRPRARTLQAMRASLLASAIASTLRCSRFLAASIQGLSPWRSQLLGLISTTHAACTNRTRKLIDLPYFEVPTVSQKAPGDAGELVGEHDRQHVGKGLVNGFNRSFRLI